MAHHLTHTGFDAGAPICGQPRREGDTGTHFAYTPSAWIESGSSPTHGAICAKCIDLAREVMAEPMAEDDGISCW